MNLYRTHILPGLLNRAMKNSEMKKHRPDVVNHASGVVLEIGFGSGLNLPYYTNVTKLYALDPFQEFYNLAKDEISKAAFPVEYVQAGAEKIPLADASIDVVVSTWSLCSIPDVEITLQEILRVLKPGGIFTFIEHGKSPRSFVACMQKLLTPFSKCIAGGCHLDRNIEKLVKEAGFEVQMLETFQQRHKPLAYMYKGIGIVHK